MLIPSYCTQVRFDDDDYTLDNLSRKNIRTSGSGQADIEFETGSDSCSTELATTLSPREMFERRCGVCELCVKPVCGACVTCKRNKNAESHYEPEVCLQKVCTVLLSW